jgi:hypothetical protein
MIACTLFDELLPGSHPDSSFCHSEGIRVCENVFIRVRLSEVEACSLNLAPFDSAQGDTFLGFHTGWILVDSGTKPILHSRAAPTKIPTG